MIIIYIVEDDINIREMEGYALKNSGYKVKEFSDGQTFFNACEKCLPDLVLLDIMLPEDDGFKILETFKSNAQMKDIPVIMVSSKDTELDTVKGLDLGADDYITKPFGIMEFVSRIKALLRRTSNTNSEHDKEQKEQASELYEFKGILLDDEKHTVHVNGTVCDLTYKEYELLKLFLANREFVLSRDKIMDKVWGFDYEGESRTVDMHIKTLRKKLSGCEASITTVRNVGYKLE